MSSYLNMYVVPKEGTKPLRLKSFSRSSDIYQYISDNINVPFINTESIYVDITESNIEDVLKEISNDIAKATKRVAEYEKFANSNVELINDILDTKEYIEELTRNKHYIEMIQAIVFDTMRGFNSFTKVCCNID